jgi:glyceraldehyde-3-phosphate dehydrogenase (NAD(P))
MHVHAVNVTLRNSPSTTSVRELLTNTTRVKTVTKADGFKSTANLFEYGRELGRPRGDIYEAVVWADSVSVSKNDAYFFMAVHQEAIVVPREHRCNQSCFRRGVCRGEH